MTVKEALDIIRNNVGETSDSSFNQTREARKIIIQAITNGMLIPVDDFTAYCEKVADTSKALIDKCYDRIEKGNSDTLSALAYFEQKQMMYMLEIPNIVKSYLNEVLLENEE